MYHRWTGAWNDMQPESLAKVFAVQLWVVFVHRPESAEGSVTSLGARRVEQYSQHVGVANVVQCTERGQCERTKRGLILGSFGQFGRSARLVEVGQRFSRKKPHL